MATVESSVHTHTMDVACPWTCPAHPSRFPSATAARRVPRYEDQRGGVHFTGHGMLEPALRSRTSAERKAEPIHSGALLYFPDALAAIARLSKKANVKHNPGEPMGWQRHKSNDHQDCVIRHSLTPELMDAETGEIEAVAEAWRSLANLQLLEEKRLAAAGILPYSGITP